MSRLNKDHGRFYRDSPDSPMFPTAGYYINSTTNSPVSDLAQNLSGANLGSTPRRRLSSISNELISPNAMKVKMAQSLELIDSSASSELPLSENRIQKHSPKSTAVGKASGGPLATRNRVIPWRLGPCHGSYDKENISAKPEGSTGTLPSHEGPSILTLPNSPPPKRLGGHLLVSPLKLRHPLEDHDPNSQDSGYGNCVPEGEDVRVLENSPSVKGKSASGFHPRVTKCVKIEENVFHQSEKVVVSRHVSISSLSSMDESPMTSPSRPLALNVQSNSLTPSKKASPHRSPRSLWSNSKNRSPLLHSHSSGAESIDDGFLEFFELEKASAEASETPTLPAGIGSLLSKPIVRHSEVSESRKSAPSHLTFRRCVSLIESVQTPPSSRVRLCLFRDEKQSQLDGKENSDGNLSPGASGFKRPEPPECQIGQSKSKKRRCITASQEFDSPTIWGSEVEAAVPSVVTTTPVLQRSISDSEAVIKRALLRSSIEPDLIGDFSRPYSLPLIPGRHQDLKTISSDTLAALLQGEFDDHVNSFSIIDCRYPYEFDGGHIRGAKNLFTQDQILKELMNNEGPVAGGKNSKSDSWSGEEAKSEERKFENKISKRDILVFHCEFSSERGPKLSRFLRNSDRARNKECYPALHYPEIYLLHGGYKEFFDNHSELCEPCSYLPMADPRYESDFRSCRAKSKSWTGGMGTSGTEGSRLALRGSLKRLGL